MEGAPKECTWRGGEALDEQENYLVEFFSPREREREMLSHRNSTVVEDHPPAASTTTREGSWAVFLLVQPSPAIPCTRAVPRTLNSRKIVINGGLPMRNESAVSNLGRDFEVDSTR